MMKDFFVKYRQWVFNKFDTNIKGLFKAEWYNLWHSRIFYIILAVMAVQSAIQLAIISFLNTNPAASGQEIHLNDMYHFPLVGQNGVLMVSGASLVLSICSVPECRDNHCFECWLRLGNFHSDVICRKF